MRVPSSAPTMAARLLHVADRLASSYGRPSVPRGDPLDGLILTILSQNTSDTNSERAFRSLNLHVNMVRLGREVCRARSPRCGACMLAGTCAFRRSRV